MSDTPLTTPPTEVEISELNAALEPVGSLILRRLAFQKTQLERQLAACQAELAEANAMLDWLDDKSAAVSYYPDTPAWKNISEKRANILYKPSGKLTDVVVSGPTLRDCLRKGMSGEN